MKLLHVLSSFGTTSSLGTTSMALRLVAVANAGRKVRHHVISLDGDLALMEAMPAKATGEPFLARRSGPERSVDQLGLRQRLTGSGADILCTYGAGALDAAAANIAGPHLAHLHQVEEGDLGEAGAGSRLRGLAATGAVIIVNSRSEASLARKRWRIPEVSLRVIPPGVDTGTFRPCATKAGDGELVTIGFVGELTNQRDLVTLIKAFAGIRARSAARLAIHAEGAARPAVDGLIRSMGLRERAFFRGPPQALEAIYDEIDVFIPDRYTPARLHEAMASGLPVAGEDIGDIKDTVSVENRPLIVASGDAAALTTVLSRLVNDYAWRMRVGAANAARMDAEFSLTKMTAAYHALYREIGR